LSNKGARKFGEKVFRNPYDLEELALTRDLHRLLKDKATLAKAVQDEVNNFMRACLLNDLFL
jgi:hypothetical protein